MSCVNEDLENNNIQRLPEPLTVISSRRENANSLLETPRADSRRIVEASEEYIEDPFPELTLEHLDEYVDPSFGYVFVSNEGYGTYLDNADALLRQLKALGISVNEDYLTLDLEISESRSVSVDSEFNCLDDQDELDQRKEGDNDVFSDSFEDEVAEAQVLPTGDVKVTYGNYSRGYRPRISSLRNYLKYLELVPQESRSGSAEESDGLQKGKNVKGVINQRLSLLTALRAKYIRRIKKMCDEFTYDILTPDSGVHDSFVTLTPEEQEKQREEWKTELIKVEDEIQTLRQVLASKVKTAQDLKRRLGVTVWREFTEDFTTSLQSIKDSQTLQRANSAFIQFHDSVASAPLYQKTAGALSAAGEKTTSLFGGIGAKFGQLKETSTFKSFEERVGSAYTAARSKMGGSGSNSAQDFEEAIKEAEMERASANNGAAVNSTSPPSDISNQPVS